MIGAITPRAEEVLPGIWRLACPFGEGGIVYVYFIDAPEPALVDSGVKQSPMEVIEPALRAAGKSLGAVRHLLNTHGHWDHMGGNEAVRRVAQHARTYLCRHDEYLLQSADAHVRGYSSYAARLLEDREGLRQMEQMQRAAIECPTPVDVYVEDGQVISLGATGRNERRLQVVRTPGHSDGSTSYLLEGEGALFTGDGVQGLGSRPRQLPLIFDDSNSYRGTIARVATLPLQALCMGHDFSGLNAQTGRDSVRRGPAPRTFLEESGLAAKAVEEAARSIVAENPTIAFTPFAKALFARLQGTLDLELDHTGMNPRSMATAHAFYREMTGAPKPA